MTTDLALRILSLCVMLAAAETLHGIFRAAVLVPRIGKKSALKVAIVTGSLLAFGVCFALVPGVGLQGLREHFYLGAGLALFMAGFDVAMGRLLLRRSWKKVLADFDPSTGNLLIVGLALLVTFPALVSLLRGAG